MPQYTVGLPDGKQMVVEADSEDAALSGAQNWFQQNTTQKTDTSVTGALSQGARDVAQGFGKTIKHYINPEAGDAVLNNKNVQSDPKYRSASQEFMRPSDGPENHLGGLDWSKAPRALVEQAPALATDVAAQLLLKRLGPVGSWLGNAVSFGGRTAGNEAEKRAAERTGDPNAQPNTEDKIIGLKSTAEQGVLNKVGLNSIVNPAKVVATGAKGVAQAGANVLKGAAVEGVTNAAQDAISQAEAKQSFDLDPQSLKGAAALGAMGGGLFSAPRGAKDAAAAARFRNVDADEHSQMAANRILSKVDGNAKALEDPKAAFDAVSKAKADAQTEFNTEASNVRNPSQEAANAIERARKGEGLDASDLAAIDKEGNASLSSLARQVTHFDTLTSKGNYDTGSERFAGGVGEFARRHAKSALLTIGGGAALPHVIAKGGVGLDTLSASLPGMAEGLAGGYVGYKALKKIESMMGVQSPARTFAEKFGGGDAVRPDVPMNQSPTGPKVIPQNSLTTPQPWGPVEPKPERFKPDVLEPGIRRIVEKVQNQKRRDTVKEAMPLLRQLAEQNRPAPEAPGLDASAIQEQIKGAMLMASHRRKIEGQRQAEAEAAASPMIDDVGGLDAVRNPAMGKRANELISAATALQRLRRVPEAEAPEAPLQPEAPPPSPAPAAPPQRPNMDLLRALLQGQAPQPDASQPPPVRENVPEPKSVAEARGRYYGEVQPHTTDKHLRREAELRFANDADAQAEFIAAFKAASAAKRGETSAPEPEPFVLPQSKHVFKEPKEAAAAIYDEAVAGGKTIRHPEGYKAGVQRRLAGEEAIYNSISKALNSTEERGAFHDYLSALWGSDSPEVVKQVREHMLASFPHHAETINKHLSDEAIKGLWTKPAKKKPAK